MIIFNKRGNTDKNTISQPFTVKESTRFTNTNLTIQNKLFLKSIGLKVKNIKNGRN